MFSPTLFDSRPGTPPRAGASSSYTVDVVPTPRPISVATPPLRARSRNSALSAEVKLRPGARVGLDSGVSIRARLRFARTVGASVSADLDPEAGPRLRRIFTAPEASTPPRSAARTHDGDLLAQHPHALDRRGSLRRAEPTTILVFGATLVGSGWAITSSPTATSDVQLTWSRRRSSAAPRRPPPPRLGDPPRARARRSRQLPDSRQRFALPRPLCSSPLQEDPRSTRRRAPLHRLVGLQGQHHRSAPLPSSICQGPSRRSARAASTSRAGRFLRQRAATSPTIRSDSWGCRVPRRRPRGSARSSASPSGGGARFALQRHLRHLASGSAASTRSSSRPHLRPPRSLGVSSRTFTTLEITGGCCCAFRSPPGSRAPVRRWLSLRSVPQRIIGEPRPRGQHASLYRPSQPCLVCHSGDYGDAEAGLRGSGDHLLPRRRRL
jgi:hypothetical protein